MVRCPFDTEAVFCRRYKSGIHCSVGSTLYSDLQCYDEADAPSTENPIGIVFDTTNKLAMSLEDAPTTSNYYNYEYFADANWYCQSQTDKGKRRNIPSKANWQTAYDALGAENLGIDIAVGDSDNYWTTDKGGHGDNYCAVIYMRVGGGSLEFHETRQCSNLRCVISY